MSQPIIVIDPGHGGVEHNQGSSPYGSRGPGGLCEKDLTLGLAKRVAKRLGGAARTVLTRNGDNNPSLATRAQTTASNRANVFLSLHANSGQPYGRGTEVFIHDGSEGASEALARNLSQALSNYGLPQLGLRRAPLTVLHPSRIGPNTAACLVEVDNLSNPEAERCFGNPKELDAIAYHLSEGILSYLRTPSIAPAYGRATTISEGQGAGVVVAVGTLGYAILKDALTNSGDISYQLTKMKGIYFPGKDTNPTRWQKYAGVDNYKEKSYWIKAKYTNNIGDEISAKFDIEWWTNGYAIGPTRISVAGTNDAVGWGLKVTTDISTSPQLYAYKGGNNNIARIDIRFTYTFSRSIGSDLIYRHDLHLYGNGIVGSKGKWLQ